MLFQGDQCPACIVITILLHVIPPFPRQRFAPHQRFPATHITHCPRTPARYILVRGYNESAERLGGEKAGEPDWAVAGLWGPLCAQCAQPDLALGEPRINGLARRVLERALVQQVGAVREHSQHRRPAPELWRTTPSRLQSAIQRNTTMPSV